MSEETQAHAHVIADAIRDALLDPEQNGGPDNVAEYINRGLRAVAGSITPLDAAPGEDATMTGQVGSLTEAVMGMTAGLCRIAEALSDVAEAIRETSNHDTEK